LLPQSAISDNVSAFVFIANPMSITIRSLVAEDCITISQAFAAQGWAKAVSKFEQYQFETTTGKRRVLVAEFKGSFAGYVNVVWTSEYPPFREQAVPEITDLNVLIKFRRQGVATVLLHKAESLISEKHNTAGVRVGVDPDYGAAQRLYVRRGYVPDGRGLSYRNRPTKWGDTVRLDDDLTLALTKKLD
jgi:ribosomal protein S18 acetylase RimI-like enzyme